MSDSRNMILAVVLSALVLLGWSFVANQFFPTANPPVTESGKPAAQSTAAPAPGPAIPAQAQALQPRSSILARTEGARIVTDDNMGTEWDLKGRE